MSKASCDASSPPFHPDFPPKELVDVEKQDVAAIAQWYRDHIPEVGPDPTATDEEKAMYSWGPLEYMEHFKAGKTTCTKYVTALVKRIMHYRKLNAFMVTTYESTGLMVEQAKAIDAKAKAEGVESVAPLYGLPVAIKGTAATVDFPSSAGTGVLDKEVACKDAAIVAILRSRHAVILGKTNVPDFACSWVTQNYTNGVTRNPHNLALSPGGSSGGSAVAVAARLAPLAVTEDTGGSTRHPASCNGVFGYDPSRNHYPNDGNPGMTFLNDQIGLNARAFNDILLLDGMINDTEAAHQEQRGKAGGKVRVAFPENYFQRYTIPKKAVNLFQLQSCRASQCIRDALGKAKEMLKGGEGVEVVDAEWHTVYNDELGEEVNALYTMHYGIKVNTKHFEPIIANMHPVSGLISSWLFGYFDNVRVTMHDILKDARTVGLSHSPAGFLKLDGVAGETQFRYMGTYAEKCRQIWNKFFDDNNVDVIVTPSQFTPTLRLDELAEGAGPLEVLQPDGSYEVKNVATAVHTNSAIQLVFKHFPIPKVNVPLGVDSDGRPISCTLWGRSVPSEEKMYDDEYAKLHDIPFLHQAKKVIDLIHSESSPLRPVEPALNTQ